MKLKTIIKFSFSKRNKLHFLLLIFIVFLIHPYAGHAQHFQFKFENTSLSKALTEVAHTLKIKISFDADKLDKQHISKEISFINNDKTIASILEDTGYTFEYKYGTYLILRASDETKKLNNKILVSGIISDVESGERLPYATVLFFQENKSIVANVEGIFSAQISDSTPTFIQIRYLGYSTLDTTITANAHQQIIHLPLSKKTTSIKEVEIKGENLEIVDFNEEAGYLTFNPSRFSDLPNYGETDIFRALQMLPGISSRENSSQLNIRGSSADQNLVMFDGFTLYNLDHFFGAFSALNPYVIKNIKVYRGGFDSRYGERVSGIVDITGKSGNQQKSQFYGGVNLISGNLTAEIPISKKLTVVAAGRRAYSDMYSSWLAKALLANKIEPNHRITDSDNSIEPKFYFSDYNLKLSYTISPQENISFSGYGATDDLNSSNILNRNTYTVNTEDINRWGNYGFGLSWKKHWNPKYFSNLQIGHSGYFNNYGNNTTIEGDIDINELAESDFLLRGIKQITNEENDLIDYFLTFKNKYFLNTQNQLEFGFSSKFNQFKFYKDASLTYIYNNIKNSAFLYTLFLQDKITSKSNFVIKPGFRINYYSPTKKINIEPRLSASYKTQNGIVFKMATGRYFQYLNKSSSEQSFGYNRDFWVLSNNDQHPVVSSNHFIFGASYQTKGLFFDIEAYYKTVDGLQEYLFFQNPDRNRTNGPPASEILMPPLSQFISGDGLAYGIDFLAKYENTNFTSWLAYSISKATRNFDEINSGNEIPASFDQTHELKWTNIYNYKKWNFSTLSLFTTGHPYIATTSKTDDFSTTRTYNRLPDYFRIDFSANYNITLKKIKIKPGLSILNALNTKNYLDIYMRTFNFQNEQIIETTLIEAQNLTLNFFVNFQF